jgi:hypothetical protein
LARLTLLATLGFAVLAGPALATTPPPSSGYRLGVLPKTVFDHTAVISADGLQLKVSGPQACLPIGAKEVIRVVVTQRGGAVATGRWTGHCTAKARPWSLTATAEAGTRFDPGTARACGLGIAFKGTRRNDAIQWCATIQLVRGLQP